MPRRKVSSALPHSDDLDVEIGHLRDLDVEGLRRRWHAGFGRPPPPHLSGHLLFRTLAYRLQVDCWGDLDGDARRLLDHSCSPEQLGKAVIELRQRTKDIRAGTMLSREWKGRIQRVAVLADGFAWNGKTYPSLSQVALAITGTRWNGPRFFGLRDKPSKGTS
jgi:hypothetical protein